MASIPVKMENFEEVVDQNDMVILDFWAEWCGPCKVFGPIFEEMAALNPDIRFGKVNTEEATDLAAAFQIRSIPSILAFKKGDLVFEQAGILRPQQFQELLDFLRSATPASEEAATEV